MAAAGVFPDWAPVVERVSLEAASAHLAARSLPVALPGAAASSPPAPLRLFEAAALPLSAGGGDAELAAPLSDAACFAGAAVWALDWCPLAAPSGEEFLLLGTHAAGAPPAVLGAAARGPGALQLWRVPPLSSTAAPRAAPAPPPKRRGRPPKQPRTADAADAGGAAADASDEDDDPADEPARAAPPPAHLPSLALLLAHDGGTAWDVKWRPQADGAADVAGGSGSGSGGSGAAPGSLGLFAAALGDGTVVVAAAPHPTAVQGGGASAGLPAAIALRPSWRGCAGPAAAGRAGGLPWCLAWHPSVPSARLLAGATDGRCFLWDLSACIAHNAPSATAPAPAVPPLLQLLPPGPPLAVRSVCWAPAALGPACGPLACCAGDDGAFSVWDVRSPGAPSWRGRGAQTLLLSAAWQAQPRCLLAVTEHGRLLLSNGVLGHAAAGALPREARNRAGALMQLRASATGTAVWGLDVADGVAALCGADGELVAATLTAPKSGRSCAKRVTLASQTVQRPPPPPPADASTDADADAGAGAGAAPPPAEPLLRLRGAGKPDALPAADGEVTGDAALKGAALHRCQALHRCRWSAAPASKRALAAAGAAGVLRVLRVRVTPQSGS